MTMTKEQLKFDAVHWGNALNSAGWKFNEAYRRVMGEPTSGKLFNSAKTILREAIIEYINEMVEPQPPVFVLVHRSNRSAGHGDTAPAIDLAMKDLYSSDERDAMPAFASLEAANEYLIETGRAYWYEVFELKVQK